LFFLAGKQNNHCECPLPLGKQLKRVPKSVENQGIDPCASCMLSMRSTI
jgi:hypothetical protein